MQTSPATGPFTLTTFSITQIATPIYEPSSIAYTNDTNSYTTIDLNQSKLTKINSWCTTIIPTYSALKSTQTAETTFKIDF